MHTPHVRAGSPPPIASLIESGVPKQVILTPSAHLCWDARTLGTLGTLKPSWGVVTSGATERCFLFVSLAKIDFWRTLSDFFFQ